MLVRSTRIYEKYLEENLRRLQKFEHCLICRTHPKYFLFGMFEHCLIDASTFSPKFYSTPSISVHICTYCIYPSAFDTATLSTDETPLFAVDQIAMFIDLFTFHNIGKQSSIYRVIWILFVSNFQLFYPSLLWSFLFLIRSIHVIL